MTLAAAFLLTSGTAAGAQRPPAQLLIAIVRQAPSTTLTPQGSAMLVLPGGKVSKLELQGPLRLRPRVGGLRLADLALPTETRLVPALGSTIQVGADRHAGALILRLDPGQTVTIVEQLGVDEYIEGVLPHEMDAGWPLEALKAQAVVARTFAYANRGKFRREGFDLTADTRSQVFRGLRDVTENVRSAVRQTRGEVLGWDGKLLRAYYHSCCGGATTDLSSAWDSASQETPPPLRGVRDPWCRLSPHMAWTAYFAWAELTAAISERHALSAPLTALRLGPRNAAGYARSFIARAGGDSVSIAAAELRAALGASELKSLRIKSVAVRNKGVEFRGSGSGHGVGLCQWGARLQAEKGRGYEQILRFYFPGAELAEVEE